MMSISTLQNYVLYQISHMAVNFIHHFFANKSPPYSIHNAYSFLLLLFIFIAMKFDLFFEKSQSSYYGNSIVLMLIYCMNVCKLLWTKKNDEKRWNLISNSEIQKLFHMVLLLEGKLFFLLLFSLKN